jgi:hypothetical protein
MTVPRITKEKLKRRLDDPPVAPPVLIDLRSMYPYEHSTIRLPGALPQLAGPVGGAPKG